jgi:hypothetical protein
MRHEPRARASAAAAADVLDEQQVVLVEPGQVPSVRQRVRGVGVDLQQHVGPDVGSDGGHQIDVAPGFDLQLDADVPVAQVPVDGGDRLLDGVEQPDRYARRHLGAGAAEVRPQRQAGAAQLGVEHGRLQCALRHRPTAHAGQHGPDLGRRHVLGRQQPRYEVVAQHEVRRRHEFVRVARLDPGDVLAPPLGAVAQDADQHHIPSVLDAERGPERRHQRQLEADELDGLDVHSEHRTHPFHACLMSSYDIEQA